MGDEVYPGAEGFFFQGGGAGVLVLHGFTGCPFEMKELGRAIAAKGFTVLGPRLAGHGGPLEQLERYKAGDWITSARDACGELSSKCGKIVLMGLSMGGALSLMLGAENPVLGIVTLNAPVFIKNKLLYLLPAMRHVIKRLPNKPNPNYDLNDMIPGPYEYTHTSLPAVAQCLRVLRTAQEALPRITAPLASFHSNRDPMVSPSNGPFIHARVASTHKELHEIESVYHVPLVVKSQKARAVERISAVVERFALGRLEADAK